MQAGPVLLVDQDGAWCARVCRFLEPHGISVLTARNFEIALDVVRRVGKPSAVVVDLAARAALDRTVSTLREDATWRDVPIGYVNKEVAFDALLLLLTSNAAGSASIANADSRLRAS
jgi:DNA-binding response OmpR family regulator